MSERPTIVILHGQPGSSVDSVRLRRALPSSVCVLTPDRPGYGANPAAPSGFFGNARAVVSLLDDAEVASATLVGHSWGGGVALAVAEQFAERVDGLVLAASVGPDCLNWVDRVLAMPYVGEVLVAPAFVLGGQLARRRLRRAVGVDAVDDDARRAAEASILGAQRRPTWRSFLVEQRALYTELPSINASLRDVRAPTAVVTGTKDHFVPSATARMLAHAIPGAQLVEIDGIGHLLPVRAPAALARVVLETMERARDLR
ncbi:MAG TPA: alpha/beta hydrolase [Acidimicrobiia bacterium]|nr:alpha/beta hydrolase [Acidimicrobiia bacterium]